MGRGRWFVSVLLRKFSLLGWNWGRKLIERNRSLFKGDEKNERVKVNEVLILECEAAPEGKGVGGLWVVGAKSYFDPAPVREKGMEVMNEEKINW